MIWTGTHNFTSPALYENHETLIKLSDDAWAYRRYLTYAKLLGEVWERCASS